MDASLGGSTMKKNLSKLQLNRETLAALASQSLQQIAGGVVTDTCSCTTACSFCPSVNRQKEKVQRKKKMNLD